MVERKTIRILNVKWARATQLPSSTSFIKLEILFAAAGMVHAESAVMRDADFVICDVRRKCDYTALKEGNRHTVEGTTGRRHVGEKAMHIIYNLLANFILFWELALHYFDIVYI